MGKLVEAAIGKCMDLHLDAAFQMMGLNHSRVGLILGTGWGDPLVIERYVKVEGVLSFSDCGIGAVGAISGHAGKFIFGTWGDISVVISSGRIHFNQTHDDRTLLRSWMGALLAFMGKEQRLIVTQAIGGLVPELPEEALAMPATTFVGHLQPTYMNPGEFFTPEAELPKKESRYMQVAVEAAHTAGLQCYPNAFYFPVCGPIFGGRGDRKVLKALGFHSIGMSLIPELALTAVENSERAPEQRIRVGSVQFVTDNKDCPTHEENTDLAHKNAEKLGVFLNEIIRAEW